jgi:choline kinase
VAVNSAHCGEEEVKYRADKNGFLLEISKQVANPQGEAVGINRVSREDLISFKKALQEAADEDYFEKGIELMLERGKRFKVVNISEYRCIEVDFPADWEVAVSLFSEPPAAATEESNEQNE